MRHFLKMGVIMALFYAKGILPIEKGYASASALAYRFRCYSHILFYR